MNFRLHSCREQRKKRDGTCKTRERVRKRGLEGEGIGRREREKRNGGKEKRVESKGFVAERVKRGEYKEGQWQLQT